MARKINTVTLTGLKDVDRAFAKFPKDAKKWMRVATRNSAKVVLAEAKTLVPVDTGNLRKSLKVRAIKRSRVKQGHTIGSSDKSGSLARGDAFYAAMIELGTKNMPAQPFLRPALFNKENEAKAEAVRQLRKAIAEAASKKNTVRR